MPFDFNFNASKVNDDGAPLLGAFDFTIYDDAKGPGAESST